MTIFPIETKQEAVEKEGFGVLHTAYVTLYCPFCCVFDSIKPPKNPRLRRAMRYNCSLYTFVSKRADRFGIPEAVAKEGTKAGAEFPIQLVGQPPHQLWFLPHQH